MAADVTPLKPRTIRPRTLDLQPVVEGLRHSRDTAHNIRLGGRVAEVPSAAAVAEILDGIVTSLFPAHLGPRGLGPESIDMFVANALSNAFVRLREQVARGLAFDERHGLAQARADEIAEGFALQLPEIRARLVSDLRAAQARDSSAESLAEVLICYPSTRAIIHYRLAHALHEQGARFVARIVSALAQSTTGIDIHPAAEIGRGLFIRNGVGLTIGETAVIGENVCLHQGVTLGESDAGGEDTRSRRSPRHPIIEDKVVIHAGATLLGRMTVGAGSIIGGNVWLTRSILPGSIVTQAAHAVSAGQSAD